jgi:hypothetical protein
LIRAKRAKRDAYDAMLASVRNSSDGLTINFANSNSGVAKESEAHRALILASADRMLADENMFFTFPYQLRAVERPWNFDPIERKHWPARHYTEQLLHAADTPKDVKIVWEINRFKDLPTVAQAAALTKNARYADEIERRMLSWIDDNPFAESINWASGLEIGIRLISWLSSLTLLTSAGFTTAANEKIRRSLWEQVQYLAAELSTDKVVRSNHLIGEAAGLFVACTLCDFSEAKEFSFAARAILEKEILDQTFSDGATRESSMWYHRFVMHLFEIVSRTAECASEPMSTAFTERLSKMRAFTNAMKLPDTSFARLGDADDGWALWLEGDRDMWESLIFGGISAPADANQYFAESQYISARLEQSQVVLRAGAFGMGGSGFSSHAHDDQLSPILFLKGISVLVDPGTFVYNGAPEERKKFRGAPAHNGITINASTGAIQKLNFGWQKARKAAKFTGVKLDDSSLYVEAVYGEWRKVHDRTITVTSNQCWIRDDFRRPVRSSVGLVNWFFHLDPQWSLESISENAVVFLSGSGSRLLVDCSGNFGKVWTEKYDYSPSYFVKVQGVVLRAEARNPTQERGFTFSVVD